MTKYRWFIWLSAFSIVQSVFAGEGAARKAGESPDAFYEQRGITYYAPLNGSVVPVYTRGIPEPIFADALHWTSGRNNEQALLLRQSQAGGLGTPNDRPSGLNLSAAGLLYSHAGTLAYWVRPSWAVGDLSNRTDAGEFGPKLINVSAFENAYYHIFLRNDTRGSQFYFWIVDQDGKHHGFSYREAFDTWEADQWQHVVFTWDERVGVRIYNNGELKYESLRSFKAVTPRNISFSASGAQDRPALTRAGDAAYEEVVMLERMVDDDEVHALYHSDLSALKLDWDVPRLSQEDIEHRRIQMHLDKDPERITLVSRDGKITAKIEQLFFTDIEASYYRLAHLSDGRFEPLVRFSQGGLAFARDLKIILEEGKAADYLYVYGDLGNTEEASFSVRGGGAFASETGKGFHRVHLGQVYDEIDLHVPAAAEVGEIAAYTVTFEVPDLDLSLAEVLNATGQVSDVGAGAESILRRHIGAERRVLVAGETALLDGGQLEPTVRLQLASAMHTSDVSVASVRMRLKVRSESGEDVLRLRILNPFEDEVHYAYVDVNLAFNQPNVEEVVDLTLGAGGMIFPEGSRTVVEIASQNGLSFTAPPELYIDVGSLEESAKLFAQNYVRQITHLFTERMAWNFVFLRRGVETENALSRALDTILKYDPENEHALQMASWAPLRPWPEHDLDPDGEKHHPLWAKYARLAAIEARDVIHFWIDQRQDETGYLIGNADVWNDDTKLFNEYSFLGLIAGDQKVVAAIERFLDAHWNVSGHMHKGWSRLLTDIVHSAEEANYLEPALTLLRYGEPVYMNRLFRTAANVDYWTAINQRGHRHFRSNYFTADQMRTEGEFGYDVGLNATAMIPTMYIAWYSRHPIATRQLIEWMDGWLDAVEREVPGKPAGLIPSGVHFETAELLPDQRRYPAELAVMFAAAYYLTGDEKYLRPMLNYIEAEDSRWMSYTGMTAADLRNELGESAIDPILLQAADERLEAIQQDQFFQRGLYQQELPGVLGWLVTGNLNYLEWTALNAWRNNYRGRNIYTRFDPHKDRVYPWGRYVLPWMYAGGNALNARGSGPWPTMAVSWDDAGYDFAALVLEKTSDQLELEVVNFAENTTTYRMRVWSLVAGIYSVTIEDILTGNLVDTQQVDIIRGTVVPISVPAKGYVRVQLKQVQAHSWSPERADLALSRVEYPVWNGDKLTVRIYNIGSVESEAVEVALMTEGRLLATAVLPALEAPLDFQPRWHDVEFQLKKQDVGNQYTVIVDPQQRGEEITRENNIVTYPTHSEGDR